MPPKKKEKKKTKKPVKAAGPTLEEKYQQTLHKIESLQDHLAMRTEVARRSQATSANLRERVREANEFVLEEKVNKYEITADLIRQYKKMQTELTSHITALELKTKSLEEQLLDTQKELKKEKEEKARIVTEKNDVISDLEYKVEHMESAYEHVLHNAFDMMADRLEKSKLSWQVEASKIHSVNKTLLQQFGFNALDV